MSTILVAIGAGIAVLTGIGAGLGIGKATSSAVDAIARQPEAESKISKNLILGCALAEATAIYGFIIGILIIIAFMLIAYRIPGLAASIALLIYTGIILAILHLYHITLTLPGIAGIILSIGMAVDANVIIFARIREEIAAGHSVAQSIDIGFKKAFSAIFDGNITTLIAAAVLGLRGSGTVKGFAATLAIGIVFSMFTALGISRWLVKAL